MMNANVESVTVVVLDRDRCLVGERLNEDTALTLFAVVSEDPDCWDDIAGYWPRYRTPVVSEFVDGLPIKAVDRETALEAVSQSDAWVVIDLVAKRLLSGGQFLTVERSNAFAMDVDENGKQRYTLCVHLPPWWELREQVNASAILEARQSAFDVPLVNREVLFGEAMTNDLAARILDTVRSDRWTSRDAANDARARYKFTIEIHRDWLMTPRDDLGGKMPRQMLHGGHEWHERVVWGQQHRYADVGGLIATPTDVDGYETAPMGIAEVVTYFDLCRIVIAAGWDWCKRHDATQEPTESNGLLSRLASSLFDIKQAWLSTSPDGDFSPEFIIEGGRRRVPLAAGVSIVGMSDQPAEERANDHIADCDCPLCNMMAEGMFGPMFEHFDGHHLELDDEFAFSMFETREDWKEHQAHFGVFHDDEDEDEDEDELDDADADASSENESDEFASAWQGQLSEAPFPDGQSGDLKLAFLLTEVISFLESSDDASDAIRQLNIDFTHFRNCQPEDRATAGKRLGAELELLVGRFPKLVSRVADFQSRIEERIRTPVLDNRGE